MIKRFASCFTRIKSSRFKLWVSFVMLLWSVVFFVCLMICIFVCYSVEWMFICLWVIG